MKPRLPPAAKKAVEAAPGPIRAAVRKAKQIGPPMPGESDEDYCKRLFGGAQFECVGCQTKIYWPGACDDCVEEFDRKYGTRKTIHEELIEVGVPRNLVRATWENFELPRATQKNRPAINRIKVLMEWKGKPERVCMLSGPPGTGKTHMAVATLRRRLRASGTLGAHFVACPGLLRAVADWSGPDPLKHFLDARFMVLDDWGQDMAVEVAARATLIGFILRRLDEGLVTVMTTNWTAQDFENVEPRLASRLQEALTISTRGFPDMRAK